MCGVFVLRLLLFKLRLLLMGGARRDHAAPSVCYCKPSHLSGGLLLVDRDVSRETPLSLDNAEVIEHQLVDPNKRTWHQLRLANGRILTRRGRPPSGTGRGRHGREQEVQDTRTSRPFEVSGEERVSQMQGLAKGRSMVRRRSRRPAVLAEFEATVVVMSLRSCSYKPTETEGDVGEGRLEIQSRRVCCLP